MTEITRKHYSLIAGNVVYKVANAPDGHNPMGVITLNGVINSIGGATTLADLAEAQKVLQHHFRIKTDDPSLEIADVIILNIVYLGYHSEDEFNNITPVQPQ